MSYSDWTYYTGVWKKEHNFSCLWREKKLLGFITYRQFYLDYSYWGKYKRADLERFANVKTAEEKLARILEREKKRLETEENYQRENKPRKLDI